MLAIWNNPFHNERTTVLGDLNRIISFWDFFFRFENVQVNFTNKNGQNSLYYAQKNQSEEMCSLLISNGAKQRTPSNKYIKSNSFSRKVINEAAVSLPQDVDVLAVLDFQIPCLRSETHAFYPRSLLTNHEGQGQKLGRPWRISERERVFKDPGRQGRRRPEEPSLNLHHDNITEKTSFVAGYKKVWCSKEFKQTKKSGW